MCLLDTYSNTSIKESNIDDVDFSGMLRQKGKYAVRIGVFHNRENEHDREHDK